MMPPCAPASFCFKARLTLNFLDFCTEKNTFLWTSLLLSASSYITECIIIIGYSPTIINIIIQCIRIYFIQVWLGGWMYTQMEVRDQTLVLSLGRHDIYIIFGNNVSHWGFEPAN